MALPPTLRLYQINRKIEVPHDFPHGLQEL
jgi:hypothetical protein